MSELQERIRALADKFEQEGITCECGHYVGGDHNGLGCYARVSYQPLVNCECKLTDDQDESEIVAKAIRALLEDAPEPKYDYAIRGKKWSWPSDARFSSPEEAREWMSEYVQKPEDWVIMRRRSAGPWEDVK